MTKNKYISFDISIHQTLSEFNQLPLNKKHTLDTLINLLSTNWVNIGYASLKEELIFKNRALAALTNYYLNPLDKGFENLIIDKFLKVAYLKNLTLISKIDKLHELKNGLLEVIDYKSGYYLPSKNEVFKLSNVNKTIYVIYKKLGVYPDLFSYYYLRHNKKLTFKITKDYIDFFNLLF